MNQERLLQIIEGPHVSEKSTRIAEHQQVALKVLPTATKPEIKAAVEHLFDVKVADVTVLNVKGKTKRFGQKEGQRKDWKKAYVRLSEGEINFAEE